MIMFVCLKMPLDEGMKGSVVKMLWFCKPETELDKRGARRGKLNVLLISLTY